MADAARLFVPIARDRSAILERLGLEPQRYVVATIHREGNVTEPSRLRAIAEALASLDERVVFPAHPRTRAALERLGIDLPLVEPLGYLDFAALAAQARVVVTDSGGLQKEAYWYGVPCVTVRPTTEWVDTVTTGANTLVGARRDRRRRRRRPLSRRRATALRRRAREQPDRCRSVRFDAGMTWDVAVIGAGYVGVPLAYTFADAGKRVLLVDVQPDLIDALNRGESHIEDVPSEKLKPLTDSGAITATADYEQLGKARAVLIALATPLSKQREPDLSIIRSAARTLAPFVQRDQVIVLESTTWPGTTREVLQPILEEGSRLKAGEDFHLAMSPERVDPGREDWTTKTTPKIVGGITPACGEAAADVYRARDRHRAHRLDPGGGRALEAAREHLPRGQHRARERARPAHRPDEHRRLGGGRGGGDEAVRLHVVQARPGPRRPLHPDRPLLPHLEGARVRLLDALHRARRRGQQQHAVLLPLRRSRRR